MSDELLKGLSAGLSKEEREARDLELLQSAEKYFGGLNEAEKAQLGIELNRGVAQTEGLGSPRTLVAPECAADTPERPDRGMAEPETERDTDLKRGPERIGQKGLVTEWAWAVACAGAFLGVVYWVWTGGK